MVHPNCTDKTCLAIPKLARGFVVPPFVPYSMHTDQKIE